jgi:hypothetical protein
MKSPQRTEGGNRQRVSAIADPRLLPYYLTLMQVSALCQFSPRTIQDYCLHGVWQRGRQWVQPQRQRRYLRDGVIAWMEERDHPSAARTTPQCRVDVSRSPELAAILEREATDGV